MVHIQSRKIALRSFCLGVILPAMCPCGMALADGGLRNTITCDVVDYDLVVGNINGGVTNYAAQQVPADSGVYYDAASFPLTACNLGQQALSWRHSSAQTPALVMNLFRLYDGRIEQIGQGWAHFGILPLQSSVCCTCTPVNPNPIPFLGAGCSDAETASINGSQNGAGPKWQVNPLTGQFTVPPANPSYAGAVARRLKARASDLGLPGALFFGEVQMIHFQELPQDTRNNTTYRPVGVTGGPNDFTFSMSGAVVTAAPGIHAWAAAAADVVETEVFAADVGQLFVAARVTDLGGGLWRYEYAVQNVNVARAIESLSIPLAGDVTVDSFRFHDVEYADGDGLNNVSRDGTDWVPIVGGGALSWGTAPSDADPNGNALRWGTMYNFGFDANAAPCSGAVRLGLFEPGAPEVLYATTLVPDCVPATPDGDYDNDGFVTLDDYAIFADCMGGPSAAPVPMQPGVTAAACLAAFNFDGDSDIDEADFARLAVEF